MGEGKAGVYILLTNDDAQASAHAEQVIQGVVNDVSTGKVTLYTLSSSLPNAAEAPENSNGSKLAVGFVKVARNDAGEKWLVDMLLGLEPDLRESTEPMAFMIYGRGRALFSSLGKGIQRDNLIQDVEFITGACSCTVKEQNPGVDLLMQYNWDVAAETIASRYGAEEGSGYDFGGDALFPELIIPAEGELTSSDTSTAEPATTELVAQQDYAGDGQTTDDPRSEDDLSGKGPVEQIASGQGASMNTSSAAAGASKSSTADGSVADRQHAFLHDVPRPNTKTIAVAPHEALQESGTTSTGAESEGQPSTFRGLLWVGAGLLGALVVLFAATFFVLRPR